MGEDKLDKILPLMFRQVPVDELAKARLRRKLFQGAELSDSDLSSVAAAGTPNEWIHKEKETD